MDFKDVVRSDIDRVFLNLQEFADEHQVQGETVKCVIDTIETQESGSSDRYGVFATDIRIHMAEGLITTPVENEEISVDDWTFTVKKVSREMGMLVIEARRYDQ